MPDQLLAWGTRLDQRDVASAQRAFLRRVNCSGSTKTAEKGQVEVQVLVTAIDEHSNTDDNSPQFVHSVCRFFKRASCGQDVINNKDMFARRDFEIPSKDPHPALFFSKNAPHSQLAGGFEGQNNAAGGWSSHCIYLLPSKVLSDKATQFLSKVRILQDAKFFPINRRM